MKGKLFEDFINRLLVGVGFDEVFCDNTIVYNGSAGKMIQGLGQSHNADVLVQPKIQIPFYFPNRLLVECKDYNKKIGINVIRSALGLRTDINNFEILDKEKLEKRKAHNRNYFIFQDCERYQYQVAVASTKGFSKQAQEFAFVHKIPLFELDLDVFKNELKFYFDSISKKYQSYSISDIKDFLDGKDCSKFSNLDNNDLLKNYKICLNNIINNTAIAVTSSGNVIILHKIIENISNYDDGINFIDNKTYWLTWNNENYKKGMWFLEHDGVKYAFMLPNTLFDFWINTSHSYGMLQRNAYYTKENYFSNIVVYFRDKDKNSRISVLKLDIDRLQEHKKYKND